MSTIRVDMAFSHHSFSVASKRGHEIKKCSIRVPDMTCFAAKHWSLTAVTGNWRTKGKLCIFFRSAHSAHISFFSTFRHISCSDTAHLPPEIIINVYKFLQRIFCWAKTNQVDNSRLLQTSNVWRQNMSCFFLMCTRLDATDGNKNNYCSLSSLCKKPVED